MVTRAIPRKCLLDVSLDTDDLTLEARPWEGRQRRLTTCDPCGPEVNWWCGPLSVWFLFLWYPWILSYVSDVFLLSTTWVLVTLGYCKIEWFMMVYGSKLLFRNSFRVDVSWNFDHLLYNIIQLWYIYICDGISYHGDIWGSRHRKKSSWSTGNSAILDMGTLLWLVLWSMDMSGMKY